MKYDLKILSKLLSNNSLNQFYYLVEDLLNDDNIQDPILFNLIGIYFQKISKEKKALTYFNKSLVLKPDTFQVLNNRGVTYFLLKKIDLAIEDFNQSLLINPTIHDTYLSLAKCYLDKENPDEAIKILEECKKKLDPNLSILTLLGRLYYENKFYEEAKNIYLFIIKLSPQHINSHNILGLCFENLFNYDKADYYFNEGLKINNKNIDILCNLGNLKRSLGKFSEARVFYDKVINIDLYQATVHRYISVINKYRSNDTHLLKLLEIIKSSTFKNNESKMHEIYFALSKAYEDLEDYETSVQYLLKGNKLRRNTVNYNSIEIVKDQFRCIQKIFTNLDLKKFTNESSAKPIFILGMPRSGTTLTEQILSSHSKVSSGGELTYLGDIIKKYFPSKELDKFYEEVTTNLKDCYLSMSKDYSRLTEKISKDQFITDKLPQNFTFIGFIIAMFPNSKIIHCQRNPKATCLSIFKNYFPDNGIWYAYNATELVEYYKLYENMMDFWNKLFPTQIFNLKYEDIVSDQIETTKNLLKFCDLEWEENCIQFYNNSSAVKTLSTTQVRSSVYKSSVDKFKMYENLIPNFLGNLNQ